MASRELRRAFITQEYDHDQNAANSDSDRESDHDHDHDSSSPSNPDDNEFLRSLRHNSTATSASPSATGRTLMDMIRKEQKLAESGSGSGSIRSEIDGTVTWKSFKDRIRLRRAGEAWAETTAAATVRPPSPPPTSNSKPLFARSTTVRTAEPEPEPEPEPDNPLSFLSRPDNSGGSGMSLMALLGQSGSFEDSDWEGEEDDDEDERDDVEEQEALDHTCCICMVKHKGAPFVPCGHTLCRLCSSELCVSQGNCPLCNGFIMEILDIF